MKKRIFTLSFVLFMLSKLVSAQDSIVRSEPQYMKYYTAWGCQAEYSYAGTHSFALGTNFLCEPHRKRIFDQQVTYLFEGTLTGLFYDKKFSVGQRVDIGINCGNVSPDFHLFFEHNNKNDFRAGFKAGINFANFWAINYRYSYPLGLYENKFISRHGITLTLKWNWVALSNLYGP